MMPPVTRSFRERKSFGELPFKVVTYLMIVIKIQLIDSFERYWLFKNLLEIPFIDNLETVLVYNSYLPLYIIRLFL